MLCAVPTSFAIEVTSAQAKPQGIIRLKYSSSVFTFKAKP